MPYRQPALVYVNIGKKNKCHNKLNRSEKAENVMQLELSRVESNCSAALLEFALKAAATLRLCPLRFSNAIVFLLPHSASN